MARDYHLTTTPLTPDPNGVFEDQTTVGAGNFTLDGAGVTDGVWTSSDDMAHQISFESAGDESDRTFTITGTNREGHALTEAVTGPNATTVESTNYFYTITQIATDGAVGNAVEAGPVDECVTHRYITDRKGVASIAIGLTVTGTANVDVEFSLDDETTQGELNWQDHSVLAAITADANSNVEYLPTCLRLKYNSYTAGASVDFNLINENYKGS
jgi:VCBS repeat-containing protein